MPAWKAWSRRRKDSPSVFCSPKVMVPKQSLETVRLGARLKRGTPHIAFNSYKISYLTEFTVNG